MKKKAFTLIEILIAMVLAGILFVLIFKAYVSITQITARLGNEKKLDEEIVFLTETIQNIADTYQIDFSKYDHTLIGSQGRTDTLYLTGVGTTGAMLLFSGDNLFRVHDSISTQLISSGAALISSGTFRVIPFSDTSASGINFLDIQHPGFRFIAHLQLTHYNPHDRVRNVENTIQQFYNLQANTLNY